MKNPPSPEKFALIIGNDDYATSSNKLMKCDMNIKQLSEVLTKMEFNVTLKSNMKRTDMLGTIKEFKMKSKECTIALFYFCGHGSFADGENYLIPVEDNDIENYGDLDEKAVYVERNLKELMSRQVHAEGEKVEVIKDD
jgi:uncharacterized caspase-like protein